MYCWFSCCVKWLRPTSWAEPPWIKLAERNRSTTGSTAGLPNEYGFPAGEYTRGGTDILISMVYRIAFGRSGSDFGFASAVSVILFAVTGVLAALQFRATKKLEDVN